VSRRVFYICTPNLLIVYTFTYVRTHLPFFPFTTNTLDSAVYTYLSVHRSWGNHGPQQVGRSFLRHSVLRFLFVMHVDPATCVTRSIHRHTKGWLVGSFARRTRKFYIDILLAHVLGIEMDVEKYSPTMHPCWKKASCSLDRVALHFVVINLGCI
jgi:hypothetical protein